MDSDDDYNSGMSSQEDKFEEELQESGDDSMGEGLSQFNLLSRNDADRSEP